MLKKFFVHFRTSIRVTSILFLSTFLILMALVVIYKPIYSVTLNGEFIGYSKDKTKLQKRINSYMENGEGENIAFVQIDALPEYKMCLLKRGIVTDDEAIFEKVKSTGINYYTYYAIAENNEEKLYVSNFSEAEQIVNSLKEKNSSNKDNISLKEKYSTELKDFVSVEEAVAKLYVEPIKVVNSKRIATNTTSRGVSTSTGITNARYNIGISLIRPISGTITSKYGSRSGVRSGAHTGLDIAAPYGTSIAAAASGTVVFSGWNGSLGKMIAIDHGNGVQTYYAHCSSLLVGVGTKVSQGQIIAKVGSTGNSTGNHLHLEVRVNGKSYNPQYYVY